MRFKAKAVTLEGRQQVLSALEGKSVPLFLSQQDGKLVLCHKDRVLGEVPYSEAGTIRMHGFDGVKLRGRVVGGGPYPCYGLLVDAVLSHPVQPKQLSLF